MYFIQIGDSVCVNLFLQIELNEGGLIITNGLFRELQIVDSSEHLFFFSVSN